MNNPDIDDENDFPPSINPFVPQAQQAQIQQQAQYIYIDRQIDECKVYDALDLSKDELTDRLLFQVNILDFIENRSGMNNVDFTQSSKGAGIRRRRSTMRKKSKKYRKHRKTHKSRRNRKY